MLQYQECRQMTQQWDAMHWDVTQGNAQQCKCRVTWHMRDAVPPENNTAKCKTLQPGCTKASKVCVHGAFLQLMTQQQSHTLAAGFCASRS